MANERLEYEKQSDDGAGDEGAEDYNTWSSGIGFALLGIALFLAIIFLFHPLYSDISNGLQLVLGISSAGIIGAVVPYPLRDQLFEESATPNSILLTVGVLSPLVGVGVFIYCGYLMNERIGQKFLNGYHITVVIAATIPVFV